MADSALRSASPQTAASGTETPSSVGISSPDWKGAIASDDLSHFDGATSLGTNSDSFNEASTAVDDNESSYDGDSAIINDSSDTDSYASLTAEAREYIFENGRRYHGYKSGRYMLPNDENEMDREDIKHHITMLITKGQLHLAPIDPNPQKILDIGTGTGIWAIDMADTYPSAKVIATDLSPIQPVWVPPNLVFEIDDAEEDWPYKQSSIDFIHARYLFHGIRDWPKLLKQAIQVLKPGGWVELVEIHVIPSSYDNSLPENSQIMELYNLLAGIGGKIGIDLAVAQKFKAMMEAAGFEDVQEEVFDLPLGDWPDGRRMKEVGMFQRYQMVEGLHGIAFGLLTRVAGWSPQRVEAFLVGVRREMKDKSVHSLYKLYFVFGRKPKDF